jgi:hypothetical protein
MALCRSPLQLRKIIAHVPRKKRAGARGQTGRKRAAIMAWIRSTGSPRGAALHLLSAAFAQDRCSACICPCAPGHPSTGGLQDPRLSDHLHRCRSLWCSFRSTELRIGGREDRRSEVPPARNPDPPANLSSRSAELSRSINNQPP